VNVNAVRPDGGAVEATSRATRCAARCAAKSCASSDAAAPTFLTRAEVLELVQVVRIVLHGPQELVTARFVRLARVPTAARFVRRDP
jgi:hypothetical protein